ncbi:pilus assembly protein TadG-related protein [Nocardioides sp. SYSU D00038]|uniref:pilus assembly protein TadG-related protein n=1 Tax=Nocardioides sp. SYSU D00038 TaxID=2812554 RepID=UPI001966CF39|nr:pilus assembly protein TadG-related protein [Nocardioides sp. SYSU D00038]
MTRSSPRRARDDAGYAALLVAFLAAFVFLGLAAVGVDTARWYLEAERVQKAADAAALAGVTYMPTDLAKATSAALAVAADNGYAPGDDAAVQVERGGTASQLRVTVTSTIPNTFGAYLGLSESSISRSATADYTAPAPMGSPCNTFGNEPPSQPAPAPQPQGTALPASPFTTCPKNATTGTSYPQFWAALEGPSTDKVQGDRYGTTDCTGTSNSGTTYRCGSGRNSETRPAGYFFTVHVEPEAIGTPVSVQVYDPAYVHTTIDCSLLPASTAVPNAANHWTTTDGKARYTSESTGTRYCSGDYNPGSSSAASDPPTTSFVLRQQTSTYNPLSGAAIAGCTKQFRGIRPSGSSTTDQRTWFTNALRRYTTTGTTNAAYNPELARVFHQWVELCTFTPSRAGDYYLQVRTNVALGGSPVVNRNERGTTFSSMVYEDNSAVASATGNTPSGTGLNAFSVRAVPSSTTMRTQVSVSGSDSMPILQNVAGSTAVFNLVRALPGTHGQYITFDVFDAADGATTSSATIRVLKPLDATGSLASAAQVPGCRGAKNGGTFAALSNCTATVRSSTHDGALQNIVVPIPHDYGCDATTLGGCWFRVEVSFPGTVTDFTTWDANIGGDPVRLVD